MIEVPASYFICHIISPGYQMVTNSLTKRLQKLLKQLQTEKEMEFER
ncbi:hypothetical protein [Methanobacterium sp. ACI-7]